MIVETDHLRVKARNEALDLLEERGYSGLITSHSWGDESSQRRLAGARRRRRAVLRARSPASSRSGETAKEAASPEYLFGIGFGTDTNGLGAPAEPARRGTRRTRSTTRTRPSTAARSWTRQVSGERTCDVNVDGVAHYGLFPDWIEDMRSIAGPEIVDDLANGAEAYLQMWERAEAHEG